MFKLKLTTGHQYVVEVRICHGHGTPCEFYNISMTRISYHHGSFREPYFYYLVLSIKA